MKHTRLLTLVGCALLVFGFFAIFSLKTPLRAGLFVIGCAPIALGASIARRAARENKTDRRLRVTVGLVLVLIGLAMLVASIWSASIASRLLGLGMIAAFSSVAYAASHGSTTSPSLFALSAIDIVLGVFLLLFAGERGVLTGFVLAVLGFEALYWALVASRGEE